MSKFECSLKDLNKYSENSVEDINEGEIFNKSEVENSVLQTTKQDINIRNSLFNKITEEKNIRIVLLVIIAYLITNSQPFMDFLTVTLPYLMEGNSTNLLGKIVISTLIGLTVVIFTSFLWVQVP